jgi:hypothetical protein
VGTALVRLLIANQRLHGSQVQRTEVQAGARTAVAFIPTELRELDAAGGDIIAMTPTSVTYKSMTGVFVQCAAPDAASSRITLAADGTLGLRPVQASTDSVLIFAEGDVATTADDAWLHADVTEVIAGTGCPGGAASVGVGVSGVTAGDLAMVTAGSPVRTFEPAELRLYQDGAGDWWLGARQYAKGSRTWSATQPIVGPLSASGFVLTYADSAGAATSDPTAVHRIGIAVESRSRRAVRGGGAGAAYEPVRDSLVTAVAVRNNRRD